jgi:hypothetical protein
MSVRGISSSFEELSPTREYVTYVLLSRLPLTPKGSFDLHVLSTPPAFVLSQDQTLHQSFESALTPCLMKDGLYLLY